MEKAIKDKKLSMIVGANLALSYKKQHPLAETEEIFRYTIKNTNMSKETKVFGIASVNLVLKYLEKNPKATEKEVMGKVASETNNILEEIENQEIQ